MAGLKTPFLVSRLSQRFENVRSTENLMDCFSDWDPSSHCRFEEHNSEVWSCAISSDNQTIFSGSKDGKIIARNSDGKTHYTLDAHQEIVGVLILTRDQKMMISADWDSNIFVWDMQTRDIFKKIKGNSSKIYTAALSHCGKFLATCGEGPVLDLWNALDWTIIKSIQTESKLSLSVVFNCTSTLLAVSCTGGVIKIFNTESFNIDKRFSTETNPENDIQCMALASNDTFIIIGFKKSNEIKILHAKDGSLYHTFSNFINSVRGILVTNDSKYIIAYSADQSIKIFDLLAKSHEYTIDGCEGFLYSGCLSEDNSILICTSSDAKVRKWDFCSNKRVKIIEMQKENLLAMDISKDDRFMATEGKDYLVKITDLSFNEVFEMAGHSDIVHALRFSLDGKWLASGSKDKTVKLWDMGKKIVVFDFTDHDSAILCIAFTPDSQVLIAGSHGIFIYLYETKTGKKIRELKGHTNTISAIEVSNDGKYIVSGSSDYSSIIWKLETGQSLNKIRSGYNEVDSIAFSPKSDQNKQVFLQDLIAFGYKNGEIDIFEWPANPEKEIIKKTCYKKHSDRVKDIVFSSDSSFLISCSYDKTILVWNILENIVEYTISWKSSEIRKVHLNSTNTQIVSADKKGKVFFWTIINDNSMDLADIRNPIDSYLYLSMIKKGEKINPNHINYKFGNTRINMIHFYSFLGKEKLLAEALHAGAEIKRDINGKSPLFFALSRKLQACVDEILKYLHELKNSNLQLFLIYSTQIRDDFEFLIKNYSVHLPEFLDDIFFKVSLPNSFAVPKRSLPIIAFLDLPEVDPSIYFYNDLEVNGFQDKVNFQILTMPFSIPSELGSESSLKFLESINECSNPRILQTRLIQAYIKQKWDAVFYFIMTQTVILALIIILMILLVVGNHLKDGLFCELIYFKVPFIVLNGLHVIYEMIQVCSLGIKYFSFWNFIDVLRLVVSLTWVVLSFYWEQSESFIFILTFLMVCFNLIRGITCFRVFDKSRYYVRLIKSAISDSFYFLLIFFYSTLSFGVLYFLSADKESDIWSIWTAPYELNMGVTDRINNHGKTTYIYFFLASVINVIIMLNLLISILGDTFDAFQLNASQMDFFEMAELVHEVESLMFWKRGEKSKRFLHLCEVITGREEDNWNGKVKQIIDMVKKLKGETNAQIFSIQKNNDLQFQEIKEKIDQGIMKLHKKIDLQYQNINQKIEYLIKASK